MWNATFVLGGVVLPAVLSGLVLGLGWRLWRAEDSSTPSWPGPLALTLGFLGAFVVIAGPGAWPAEDRTLSALDWTFWGAASALLVALVSASLPEGARSLGRWLGWLLMSLALTRVVANSAEATWQVQAGIVVGWLVLVRAAEALAGERSGAAAPLALWSSATGLAVVAGLSGSAKLGQLGGALAAALGAACVLAWWRPRLSLAAGGATLAVFVLAALGLNAHVFSYTTATDALLCATSLVTPLAARLPGLDKAEGPRRAALILILALVPVAIAVTRAALAFEPDPYAGY